MQESTIYQYIFQKGEKIGEQRSKQRVEKEEALKYTLRLLNKRFGEIDSVTTERLQVLSTEELESLGEALLDFSNMSDLVAWLEQNTNT
jgi:predicted transposase YdaD